MSTKSEYSANIAELLARYAGNVPQKTDIDQHIQNNLASNPDSRQNRIPNSQGLQQGLEAK